MNWHHGCGPKSGVPPMLGKLNPSKTICVMIAQIAHSICQERGKLFVVNKFEQRFTILSVMPLFKQSANVDEFIYYICFIVLEKTKFICFIYLNDIANEKGRAS